VHTKLIFISFVSTCPKIGNHRSYW